MFAFYISACLVEDIQVGYKWTMREINSNKQGRVKHPTKKTQNKIILKQYAAFNKLLEEGVFCKLFAH